MTWTCLICSRQFVDTPQAHSCGGKITAVFFEGKSIHSAALFDHLVSEFNRLGPVGVYSAKTMIGLASVKKFAYVIQAGKNFIDVVLPFKQAYTDTLCFNKVKRVPGSSDYNHHLRLYLEKDINDEVRKFMKMAYETGLRPPA